MFALWCRQVTLLLKSSFQFVHLRLSFVNLLNNVIKREFIDIYLRKEDTGFALETSALACAD